MDEKTIEVIENYLKEEATTNELVNIVRDLNNYNGNLESLAWEFMDDFDELCEYMKPSDIAMRIFYGGEFNPNDMYFRYDGYGNFESTNYPEYDSCDIDEIIEEIDNIPYQYLPTEIQFIIDEVENKTEE